MWWVIGISLALSVVSVVMAANIQQPNSSSSVAVEDIKAPTSDPDRPIPILFGTREITGANVLWYGDIATAPIKSNGSAGGRKK